MSKSKYISIHAPREGSDKFSLDALLKDPKFQSTLPVRGATAPEVSVSPLAPISIHAPREGSDGPQAARTSLWTYFNPRSP